MKSLPLIFVLLPIVALHGAIISPEDAEKLNAKLTVLGPKLKQLAALSTRLDEPLAEMIYSDPEIAAVYSKLGELECNGLDSLLGVPLFANFVNDSTLDFSGRDLCNVSCRGKCVPYPRDQNVGPVSFYPFSCQCQMSECDANGPAFYKHASEWKIPMSKVYCEKEPACRCDLMDPSVTSEGYLCNWIGNVESPHIHFSPPPRLSFIRWCECCPKYYNTFPPLTSPKKPKYHEDKIVFGPY